MEKNNNVFNSAETFSDNCSRGFVPYQGYKRINNGIIEPDPNTHDSEGPLKIIIIYPDRFTSHLTYNIEDENGNQLLPKGIRHISYYEEGYYLLDDNNEDELIARGDVRGGFNTRDYVRRMNVMRIDGTLLSEDWFDKVVPDIGFFNVKLGNRCYQVTLSGKLHKSRVINVKFGCCIVYEEEGYVIYSSQYKKLTDVFSSVLYSVGTIWNVIMLHGGKERVFRNGEGDAMIDYAQAILIKNNIIVLLEKDGVWYSLDSLGRLKECFYWDEQYI